MNKLNRASLAAASTLILTALLAACGGGSGGGSTPPTTGGGGGSSTPTPPPVGTTPTPPPGGGTTPTPPPTPTPAAMGTLTLNGSALAGATVAFTCGCTGDAGKISTDANGTYTINAALGAPSIVNPGTTYVPSGHNLLIVGYPSGSLTQSWTMMFVGNTPAHNLTISPSANTNTNDVAANAAAIYVFYAASQINNSNDKTFDWFNFNQIIAFANHLRTAPDATEQKFLNDIAAAQTNGRTLFPVAAGWSTKISNDGTSALINADVVAVSKDTADSTVPTQCPSINGCAGAPTP